MLPGPQNAPEPFCRPRPGDGHPLTRALILSTTLGWKEYVENTFVKDWGRVARQEMFRAFHQVR